MKVNSTVRINTALINKLCESQIRALEKTTEALHTEVVQEQVIPRDEGTLQNESTFPNYEDSQRGHTEIISSTPYARRLYYHPEFNFQKDENPNARGNWYEPWLPGGDKEDNARNTFKRFYKEESGV